MNPTSKDISTIIGAYSGTEWVYGTNMFIGKEPTMPNECLTIFDTTNRPPVIGIAENGNGYEMNGIQLRLRSTTYSDSFDKIHALYDQLNGLFAITLGSTLISSILAQDTPTFIEYDNKNRPIWVINFEIQRRTL